MKRFVAFCLLVVTACSAARADTPDRLEWFRDARFGMFIHWGIYSVPAGEWKGKTNYAEWIQLQTAMPAIQYEKFAAEFNPTSFDAAQWVATAKDAGMKYIVITAKHHDGFCMFDTKLTDYNVMARTPWHHDPMKDLAVATRAAGLKFCFYYSVPDWHQPDFPAKYAQHGFHGDPHPEADLERYVDYVKGQLRELLTNYGPIGILWFDGGGSFKGEDVVSLMHSQSILDLVHQLQPDCLVNNRLGLPADYGTPEQKIPGARSDTPFEVCMTLNKHWGYNKADHSWKPAATVIRNMADIASKGGNYLVNIGPKPDGTFPPEAVSILGDVGKWMDRYGDSIYGTSASPLDNAPKWGRVTRKGNTFYLHVFEWPADGKLTVSGLGMTFARASILGDTQQTAIAGTTSGDAITLTLPGGAPDETDSVVAMQCQ